MPTRADIEAATPSCPGRRLTANAWETCGRALRWVHAHGAWVCPTHGFIEQPNQDKVTA